MKILLSAFLISFGVFLKAEKLIVFTDHYSHSQVVKDFKDNYLKSIKEMAGEMELGFELISHQDSIPADVHAIPAIFYVGDNGKSYYKGRYSDLGRIKSFVLNQRVFSQPDQAQIRNQVWVHQRGKMHFGLKHKRFIPTLEEGEIFNEDDAWSGIDKGLSYGLGDWYFHEKWTFQPVSKMYYINVYPYQNRKKVWTLTFEIFSQHNCHVPLYSLKETSAFSSKSLEKCASQIGTWINEHQKEMFETLKDHDGLSMMYSPSGSWEKLGVSEREEQRTPTGIKVKVGDYGLDESSALVFTFPSPVNQYAGWMSGLKGKVIIADKTIAGKVDIALSTLDMGEEVLNESVLHEQMNIKSFAACYVQIAPQPYVLEGESFPLIGKLNFLGKEIPVELTATFVEGNAKQIRLLVEVDLDISGFTNLEKPDGPEPQNHTVQIGTTLVLKP